MRVTQDYTNLGREVSLLRQFANMLLKLLGGFLEPLARGAAVRLGRLRNTLSMVGKL